MFSITGGQDSNGNLLDMVGPTFSSSCLVSHINFNLSKLNKANSFFEHLLDFVSWVIFSCSLFALNSFYCHKLKKICTSKCSITLSVTLLEFQLLPPFRISLELLMFLTFFRWLVF